MRCPTGRVIRTRRRVTRGRPESSETRLSPPCIVATTKMHTRRNAWTTLWPTRCSRSEYSGAWLPASREECFNPTSGVAPTHHTNHVANTRHFDHRSGPRFSDSGLRWEALGFQDGEPREEDSTQSRSGVQGQGRAGGRSGGEHGRRDQPQVRRARQSCTHLMNMDWRVFPGRLTVSYNILSTKLKIHTEIKPAPCG